MLLQKKKQYLKQQKKIYGISEQDLEEISKFILSHLEENKKYILELKLKSTPKNQKKGIIKIKEKDQDWILFTQ